MPYAIAIGVVGGIASGMLGMAAQESAFQDAKSQMNYGNMVRGVQVDLDNMQRLEAWRSKLVEAKLNAISAGRRAGVKKVYAQEALKNQVNQVGDQTAKINGSLLSTVSGKGISMSSGTAQAILRQNLSKSSEANSTLFLNYGREMQKIDQELAGSISSKQFLEPMMSTFYHTPTQQPDISGSIMLQSVFSGLFSGTLAAVSK